MRAGKRRSSKHTINVFETKSESTEDVRKGFGDDDDDEADDQLMLNIVSSRLSESSSTQGGRAGAAD